MFTSPSDAAVCVCVLDLDLKRILGRNFNKKDSRPGRFYPMFDMLAPRDSTVCSVRVATCFSRVKSTAAKKLNSLTQGGNVICCSAV